MDLNRGAFPAPGSSGAPALNLQPLLWGLGDSRIQQNSLYSTNVPAPLSRGYLPRIEATSMAVRYDYSYSQGRSGDGLDQVWQRIVDDVPNDWGIRPSQVPPSVAFDLMGTNTGAAYTPAKGSINSYVDMMMGYVNNCLDWQQGKGHGVILCAEWPRGRTEAPYDSLLTPDAQQVMYRYAEALRGVTRPNVEVIDVMQVALDYTKNDFTPRANMLALNDVLHNSPSISELIRQLATNIPRRFGLPELPFDTAGALNSNPTLTKGSGTTAPQGYTVATPSGMTVTATPDVAITVRGKPRTACRLDISGTPTAANAFAGLRQSGLLSQLNVGDTLESWVEVLVGPGAVNFSSPCLMIDTGASATRLHGGLSITNDAMMLAELQRPMYGVWRSAKGIFSVMPASLSFQFGAYFTLANVASNVTLYLLSAKIGKV